MKKILFVALLMAFSCSDKPSGNNAILKADPAAHNQEHTFEVEHAEESHAEEKHSEEAHDTIQGAEETHNQEHKDSLSKNFKGAASTASFAIRNPKLTFTAFKTPAKVGVSGTFNSIKIQGNSFEIDPLSVNTSNPARDQNLVQNFFSLLPFSKISGQIVTVEESFVQIKINGKMYRFKADKIGNQMVVKGSLDILRDFGAQKAYARISEVCKTLHQDKTWTEVSFELVLNP
ncbi:MAG: hypothetical protein C4K58_08125 [Flavobacteriaceae bacterium]|nr:MAG: hypothetical protein C4K58_08125 [Flavobacteriaceae bacterium]